MKKAIRHAMSATLPVLAAKAVSEGKRAGRIFVRHLKDVVREKREESE